MRTIEEIRNHRSELKAQMQTLFSQILPLEQQLLSLKSEYRATCTLFDKADRELAALDGRLKIIEPERQHKPSENKSAKVTESQALAYLQRLSPEALDQIIGRLENQLS